MIPTALLPRQPAHTASALAQVSLKQSVARCGQIVARYDRTFYWGSWRLPMRKRQAMWAVYAWFRQKDELIDGMQAQAVKQMRLNQWAQQLESLFASGQISMPTDIALRAAIQQYRLPIEPFRDMLLGQRMALEKNRYQTWEDLWLYCYRVAGTVGLVAASILGARADGRAEDGRAEDGRAENNNTDRTCVKALVTLGIAMQLTNILQDVGEDARQGQIYLPLNDLQHFGYSTQDLFNAVVDQRWIDLMDYEIQRARDLFAQAQPGLAALPSDVRWPLQAAWILYRQDLKAIERSGYQVFGDRPASPLWWKVQALLRAW